MGFPKITRCYRDFSGNFVRPPEDTAVDHPHKSTSNGLVLLGKKITGKPHDFNGKNHGFRWTFCPQQTNPLKHPIDCSEVVTIWLWLCQFAMGRLTMLLSSVKHLFRLGPSKNHGELLNNQCQPSNTIIEFQNMNLAKVIQYGGWYQIEF